MAPFFVYASTLPNINRFSQLFHCQNQEKNCNNILLKIPPHLKCVVALPGEYQFIKASTENQTTSVTTHFKKLTRMVQLPATAAIEYVAACCRTRTRTRTKTRTKTGTKTKIGTITKTVRGAYARSPQVQCVYEPSRLSVPSIVA